MACLDCEGKEISLLFVDDQGIAEINHQYLNKNHPTNVISFSMLEGEYSSINPDILGDIIISAETAYKDAQLEGLSFEDELDYLMIHGLLHIIGYNHEYSEDEALIMKKKEQEIFYYLKNIMID